MEAKQALRDVFSECLVLGVCEIYKVLDYECTKTNLNLWKPFCSQRSIPFLKGVGLSAMGKKCRKCRETRKELIEFLILVSHERLCLSCWSGVLHEFLLETLDWHDSLFLHWLPCIIVRTYTRTIPPGNFPWDLRFGNKCTTYPDLKFFFLRKDIAVLNCISKDCLCDDLADAAISADPRLKEWRSRFQSSSSSDTLPVNSKAAA